MLEEFGPSIYSADGPTVSFFGFPYTTRMAVVRLSEGSVWVWSPIALTTALADEVEAIGPVRYIVSPNELHHLFLQQWAEHWPEAQLYGPPGLVRKDAALHFHAELTDEPSPSWTADIDQVVFRGSLKMEEVVFFHRGSRTVIFGDLIQRFSDTHHFGWKAIIMRLVGVLGERGSTPRDWRASFLQHGPARFARREVLAWNPERLLIAHGQCAQTGAVEIVRAALSWI